MNKHILIHLAILNLKLILTDPTSYMSGSILAALQNTTTTTLENLTVSVLADDETKAKTLLHSLYYDQRKFLILTKYGLSQLDGLMPRMRP
jgi:hypothetical protein